ncbi:aminoacyl-histidine dipeptidase [Fonticella tunisiensis]|uniref:Cytosol non-specific dipeptidase n=1 Tax=Fonticella tunisiensis TaxID=1096341 RepID=A0A4R7KS01_9CLOT|nr:aminoacyl-histidine dipeptidase [Fonticella tunisiensis]TDT61587.1 dipeptidase D [Fonticella tunisiensis]
MSGILEGLEPKSVFKFFEEISQIPRGSGNEKAISDYLVNFAKSRGFEYIQDKALNVIIRKPGTNGFENAPIVILQGHMDMVNEKNNGTVHNFEKDPIKLRIVDDMIYATGTTLGADNGIAVAYALALLDSKDIPHPPIEVIITTEEETGMGGAAALSPDNIKGSILINIDSEEEGVFLVSCAGGVRVTQKLPINFTDVNASKVPYMISIRGLKGGHSGMDINKERGNSNKLIGRILDDIYSEIEFLIGNISGGSKMNAIPREADAIVIINPEDASRLENKVLEWNSILKNELRKADPDVSVKLKKLEDRIEKAFSMETTRNIIASLVLIPNGVQSMSKDIEGLVESSTNLGVVTTTDTHVYFQSAIRSSVRTLKYNILNQCKMVARVTGSKFEADSEYPEWQYDPNSKIRALFQKVYKDKYGKEAKIAAVHAGLECGLLKEKKENLDMISFGPNLYDVHTPNEHMSISSVQRTWEFLLSVLKEIK